MVSRSCEIEMRTSNDVDMQSDLIKKEHKVDLWYVALERVTLEKHLISSTHARINTQSSPALIPSNRPKVVTEAKP